MPTLLSATSSSKNLPPLICKCVPIVFAQVTKSTSETDAIEGNASPLKPKVEIKNKSSSRSNLEVACL